MIAPTPAAFYKDPEVLNWAQILTGPRFPTLVTATVTAKLTDDFILVNTTSGAVTINLLPAGVMKGRTLFIKRVAGGNNVTIDGSGAETIDGAATVTLSANNQARLIYSDGVNWLVIASV